MNPARTDGEVAAERSSVLSEAEENALRAVREVVAAVRRRGSAADIKSIAQALRVAGGQCASAPPEEGTRVDCTFRGTCFSLTSGPAGGPVEIDFAPQGK